MSSNFLLIKNNKASVCEAIYTKVQIFKISFEKIKEYVLNTKRIRFLNFTVRCGYFIQHFKTLSVLHKKTL